MKPDEWMWYDPQRDPLVTIVDLLMQVNAKTPLAHKQKRSDLPSAAARPWGKDGKVKPAVKVQGKSWDEMTDWLASRVAH